VSPVQAALVPSPQRRALNPRHLWPWTWLAPLLAMLVVFVLTALDPLGFDSVTKSQSAKILYKIYSAGYPRNVHKNPKNVLENITIMRDNITVVLLDDTTLEKTFKETWPPSHTVHGAILNAILHHNPAAVLVDMLFLHVQSNDNPDNAICITDLYRNDFKSTAVVVDKYNERRIPIFMAAPSREIGLNGMGRREIYELDHCHKITLVSGELEGEPGQAELYPLHSDSNRHEPAALALYHAICPADGSRPINDSLNWIQGVAASGCVKFPEADPTETMEVVWGLAPANINCARAEITSKYPKLACEDLGNYGFFSRTVQLLWQGVTPEEYRLTDPFPIPYHPFILTSELLNGNNDKDLETWLGGKIVIYSSQVASTKDFVFSPIHGNVNGAFIHAMALDNLLTFGEKYIHRTNEGIYNSHWTKFLPTFIMFLASVAVIGYRQHLLSVANKGVYNSHWTRFLPTFIGFKYQHYLLSVASQHNTAEALREADENFLRWWIRWPLIGIILVLGSSLFFVLGIAPFNWLGLLVVIHVWHRVDKWFFKTVKNEVNEAGWA
jgi:CHASE2 domain